MLVTVVAPLSGFAVFLGFVGSRRGVFVLVLPEFLSVDGFAFAIVSYFLIAFQVYGKSFPGEPFGRKMGNLSLSRFLRALRGYSSWKITGTPQPKPP